MTTTTTVGGSKSIHGILSGVDEDVHTLLNKVVHLFDQHKELRFSRFVEAWQDMKFSLIFCGRPSFRELYEFTEELLDIVRGHVTSPHGPLSFRAAALYLLYALYFKQPCRPSLTVRIRLTLSEFREMNLFLDECRSGRHWDVVYCWIKLFIDHAFQFSATSVQMGLETVFCSEKRENQSNLRNLCPNPFQTEDFKTQMDDLIKVHDQYQKLKRGLCGSSNDPSLNLVNDKLPEELYSMIDSAFNVRNTQVESNVTTTSPTKESNAEKGVESEIGNRRKKLRERFFAHSGPSSRQREFDNFRNIQDDLDESSD